MTSTKLIIIDSSKSALTSSDDLLKTAPTSTKLTNGNKLKAPSVSSSSSSSLLINNPNNTSIDEDDERFYDAVDDAFSSLVSNLNINHKLRKSEDYPNDVDLDEDDDDRPCFFDTTTSRHASEMSDCSVIGNLPRFNKPSIAYDDIFEPSSASNSNGSRLLGYNGSNDNNVHLNKENDLDKNCIADDEDEDVKDVELETAWSFWIDRCVRGVTKNEYEAGLKQIYTFKTVQTFWSVFNNLPDISVIPNRYSYHLMRNTRRPLWEDEENCRGGQWKLKCKKEDTSVVWRELLLAGIGEQFSDCVSSPFDDIVGLTVGKRDKEDIIQIWNLDHKYSKNATVCDKLQELVPDVKFSVIFYKAHSLHEAYEGEQASVSQTTSASSNNHYNNYNHNYNHNNQRGFNNGINNHSYNKNFSKASK